MPQSWAYYTIRQINGDQFKRCGGCAALSAITSGRCCICSRYLRKRPRKKKDRSIEARIAAATALFDKAVTDLVRATGRVRRYRKRLYTLECERQRLAEGRPRPVKRPKPPARGIRLREPEHHT